MFLNENGGWGGGGMRQLGWTICLRVRYVTSGARDNLTKGDSVVERWYLPT